MNRRWMPAMFSLLLVVFLTACGAADDKNSGANLPSAEPIEVDLVIKEQVDVNEDVEFTSIVTQGEDLVDDASEVIYEIWREGQKEESEMVPASDQDGHHYSLVYTFEEDGIYHVQTHVTARGLHRMPKVQVEVGEVTDEEREAAENKEDDGEHHMMDDEHADHEM